MESRINVNIMKKLNRIILLALLVLFPLTMMHPVWGQNNQSEDNFLYTSEITNGTIIITVLSPENTTYADVDVILSCEFNKELHKISYSLDGSPNMTFEEDKILTDLVTGDHTLTVYAQNLDGNIEASETIVFTIKPYPSFLVITSLALVGLVGLSLIIHAIRQKEKNKKK
jgi:hypothetical protein